MSAPELPDWAETGKAFSVLGDQVRAALGRLQLVAEVMRLADLIGKAVVVSQLGKSGVAIVHGEVYSVEVVGPAPHRVFVQIRDRAEVYRYPSTMVLAAPDPSVDGSGL